MINYPLIAKTLEHDEKATKGPWTARIQEDPPATPTMSYPPHLVRLYKDDQGRRCTTFIAGDLNPGLGEDPANADLIAFYRNNTPRLAKALGEATRLLKIARCPDKACDGQGWSAVQVGDDEWEQQQCQWCDERAAIDRELEGEG